MTDILVLRPEDLPPEFYAKMVAFFEEKATRQAEREAQALVAPGTYQLYRLFDAAGRLLYIGITMDPPRRWKEHRSDKPWWPEVDKKRLEQLEGADAHTAAMAERAAVLAELPRYNKAGFGSDEAGNRLCPNLPAGCPPQPWRLDHPDRAEYRRAWHEWRAILARYDEATAGPA
jgi:predicted GIY-YIG superfamily endonuclease